MPVALTEHCNRGGSQGQCVCSSSMSSTPIEIPGSHFHAEQTCEDPDELLPPGSPSLRDDTAAALREFLNERERDQLSYDGNPFSENWALSQFWYTKDTAETIARVVADYVGTFGRVACIACPSLYHELKVSHSEVKCDLLEYDTRFEALGNFHFYDFNSPGAVDEALIASFELVIADPPYLSEDCFAKVATTVKLLSLTVSSSPVIVLTGSSMKGVVKECLNLRPVLFRPEHKSKLGNEFWLYTNVDTIASALGGYDLSAGSLL